MADHLGKWTHRMSPGDTGVSFRLDLWDTHRLDSYGKCVLAYALAIIPESIDNGERVTIFDGEDFCPSPLEAIDSDKTAGACLSFFAAYGESIRFSGADADVPMFTDRQREALETHYETLSLWSLELEGVLTDE